MQPPSELSEHLRPLFNDPEVVSVVNGDADNIDAQLNVGGIRAILNSREDDSISLSMSTTTG
jgi:hypothetical protein